MTDASITKLHDNNIDDHVDEKIKKCITENMNFFMFAGAGSGKTRSLVNSLDFIAEEYGNALLTRQKGVAVITYTNAAADEINRRIGYNPLFAISTIHSFLWELIKPFQRDIKVWVKNNLEIKIEELKEKQAKARTADYTGDIKKKEKRLLALGHVLKFSYNPNGENVGRDSLDHSEVISMGSEFIRDKKTMQDVLVSKFPILLIDESQDTKKELVDALLAVESVHSDDFTIGMFGDTMQKIYLDGKDNLDNHIPKHWERPVKVMNHRSTKRVIQLANAIRSSIDKQQQQPRSDKSDGFVRLFIAPNTADKDVIENQIYNKMSEVTSDSSWIEITQRKTLVLEHSMAATRLGFKSLHDNLKPLGQSYLDGSLVELAFLMKTVYPLVMAKQEQNDFEVMKILRKYPYILHASKLQSTKKQSDFLMEINDKLNSLVSLWSDNKIPTCIEIYTMLVGLKLFELPKRIVEILNTGEETSDTIKSLRNGLNVPFSEAIRYWDYINDNTQFSTHQGIKGLEFDRVSVIMDDESAGGFLFSYDKLLGAKQWSKTDNDNKATGKDNTPERTMRLFYVTCTRAVESLALIMYTADCNAVKQKAVSLNWFTESEIILL